MAEAELIWNSRQKYPFTSPALLTTRIYPALLTSDVGKVRTALKEIWPAMRQWPGLRAEIMDFAKRETPEFYETMSGPAQ